MRLDLSCQHIYDLFVGFPLCWPKEPSTSVGDHRRSRLFTSALRCPQAASCVTCKPAGHGPNKLKVA